MSSPIVALSQLLIHTPDLAQSTRCYEQLLGTAAAEGTHAQERLLATANVTVVLREHEGPEGLAGLVFAVDGLERMERRLRRLGMSTVRADTGTEGDAERLELDPACSRGLAVSFSAATPPHAPTRAAVNGLDHVVVATGDGDATGFFLGAQLGLDLRMDRSNEKWDARLMFFRCGDLIVEVFQRLSDPGATDLDRFFGLSWRVDDADAARERLTGEGFDVSEVRPGRKPATRVLTVRDGTSAVPTLLLEPAAV